MTKFFGRKLYCYKPNKYTAAADAMRAQYPTYAAELDQLGDQPKADWITSLSVVPTVGSRITAAKTEIAAFVLYAIPHRDLDSYSAGGAADAAAYRAIVDAFATQVAGRLCIVLLEPDAVSMIDRMSDADEAARYALIRYAVEKVTSAGAAVYIDAGSSNWIPAATMGARLVNAGISMAAGFTLNTSGTQFVTNERAYAAAIRLVVGANKGWFVDTGRAGLGPFDQYDAVPGDPYFLPPDHPDFEDAHWLNSPGRGIGARPTLNVNQTLSPGCEGYLWIKGPGGSDGADERGHPEAGAFQPWEALALRARAMPKFPAV